jgi:hypothetical protein
LSSSLDFMDETVKFDKVVDDDFFDFLPVDKCAVLVDEIEVLHEHKHFDFQLVFVLDEGVLDHHFPLNWRVVNFLLLVFLVCIVQ